MNLTNIDVIKDLLGRHGFRFSKSMGQNFLTASWVPMDIAASCMADEETAVLEIGAGVGCLTKELSEYAGRVLCIEIDNALRPVLAETMADCDNVEIFFGDAMKQDIRAMLDERFPDMKRVACANLPYNITTPILAMLLESDCFDYITIMIQREVAHRLCAKPATSDYGAFSIFTQWHSEPEILFDVTPDCFIPQPKVTSSVIRLKCRKEPPCEVADVDLFFRLVRASFNQRRKTLVNGLQSALGGMSKAEIEEMIVAQGLNPKVRGEALGIQEFANIANAVSRR